MARGRRFYDEPERDFNPREIAEAMVVSHVLSNPFYAQGFRGVAETYGTNIWAVVNNPLLLREALKASFIAYQRQAAQDFAQGRVFRPLTEREFAQRFLDSAPRFWGYGPTSINLRQNFSDESWWRNLPEWREQAKVMVRSPMADKLASWERVSQGVYRDPSTGFYYFSGTGYYAGHGFADYWTQNRGLGKARTSEFQKDGKTYQVFDNGVLQYDPSTGEIRRYGSVEEAGLTLEDVRRAQETTPPELPGGWIEDPYLADPRVSGYYRENPAQFILPRGTPNSSPIVPDVTGSVSVSKVMQETPWLYDQFRSKIRSDPSLRNIYFRLSEEDKQKVFQNYLMTGQIYL